MGQLQTFEHVGGALRTQGSPACNGQELRLDHRGQNLSLLSVDESRMALVLGSGVRAGRGRGGNCRSRLLADERRAACA